MHTVYNIGNHTSIELLDFVYVLHEELIQACVLSAGFPLETHIALAPVQPGDVLATCADVAPLERDFGFSPSTPLRIGLRRFAEWYRPLRIQGMDDYLATNSLSLTATLDAQEAYTGAEYVS